LSVTSGVVNLQFGSRVILPVLLISILFFFRLLQLIDISCAPGVEYSQDRGSVSAIQIVVLVNTCRFSQLSVRCGVCTYICISHGVRDT